MSFLRSVVAVAIFGWTGISIARFCGAVIEYLYERSESMSGAVKEEGSARSSTALPILLIWHGRKTASTKTESVGRRAWQTAPPPGPRRKMPGYAPFRPPGSSQAGQIPGAVGHVVTPFVRVRLPTRPPVMEHATIFSRQHHRLNPVNRRQRPERRHRNNLIVASGIHQSQQTTLLNLNSLWISKSASGRSGKAKLIACPNQIRMAPDNWIWN